MPLIVDSSNEALTNAFSQITVGPTAMTPANATEVSTSQPLNYIFSQSTGPIHVEHSRHVRVQIPVSNQVGAGTCSGMKTPAASAQAIVPSAVSAASGNSTVTSDNQICY